MAEFTHLGPFSDLVAIARGQRKLFPKEFLDRNIARELLGFMLDDRDAADVQVLRRWHSDGLDGEVLSWAVGFGPRTEALFLKPAGTTERLPGIVALYDHGHYKFFGKEKIADGPDGPPDAVRPFRDTYYGGRAFANALARRGFAVLIHDTFLWGSRKFPLSHMLEMDLSAAEILGSKFGHGPVDPEVERYNGAAYLNELQLAKYCALLGTSLAAITAYEDRVALNYLASRQDVDHSRLGAIGFSGGGLRSACLGATSDRPTARVIAGMMGTYEELLDRLVAPHTWMLFPGGFSGHGDIPDIAACAAPEPLLVQSALGDAMFTVKGMRDADHRIASYYVKAGVTDAYRAKFYEGAHRFDVEMQDDAFAWLQDRLGVG